ncbi:MAG: hypothetical protein C6Y22_29840 [Hapalosiphonaceae cyanobacterium JJU2]|nr:MAG: hypothetical protein C6Y22_29840 [Hapalosiphonaceae cyanobacterium JJU2]
MSNEVVTHQYQNFGIQVEQRADGFWNLTEMCKPFGKQPNDFLKYKEGKAFVAALSQWLHSQQAQNDNYRFGLTTDVSGDAIENDFSNVLEIRKGGSTGSAGTWGHRLLAIRMAMWLEPMFAIWVVSVSDRLMTQGYVSLQEEMERLNELTTQMAEELVLAEHQCDRLQTDKDQLLYKLDAIREYAQDRSGSSWAIPELEQP